MTDRYCQVEGCGRPIPHHDNSTTCPACWNRLEQDLAQMTWLVDELDTTITRQSVAGYRIGPRGNDKPLPYNLAASDALDLLHRTLWPWTREALDAHPHDPFRGSPTAVGLARTLLRHYPWLRNHPDGYSAVEEITYAVKLATRSIDTPPTSTYIGPCDTTDCTAELHVRPGATRARCHLCGEVTDVETKMRAAYTAASDRSWDLHEATSIIRNAGMTPATPVQVDRWVRSGRIHPTGHTADGAPLYRLQDLIADVRP